MTAVIVAHRATLQKFKARASACAFFILNILRRHRVLRAKPKPLFDDGCATGKTAAWQNLN
jgi:hypothetical protein